MPDHSLLNSNLFLFHEVTKESANIEYPPLAGILVNYYILQSCTCVPVRSRTFSSASKGRYPKRAVDGVGRRGGDG